MDIRTLFILNGLVTLTFVMTTLSKVEFGIWVLVVQAVGLLSINYQILRSRKLLKSLNALKGYLLVYYLLKPRKLAGIVLCFTENEGIDILKRNLSIILS